MADPAGVTSLFIRDPRGPTRSARLRGGAPAYVDPTEGFYALSRYADVHRALHDHETFSSGRGFLLEDIDDFTLPMLLGMDPPDHGRLRATISRALTPRRVAMLEPPIRERCRRLIDAFAARGQAELVGDFAALLPMWVISRLLGVPDADRDELRRLADVMVHREDGTRGVPAAGKEAAADSYAISASPRRARRRPGDDLHSLLLAAERPATSAPRIVGFCFPLIIAGTRPRRSPRQSRRSVDTRHPDVKARLVAGRRDPERRRRDAALRHLDRMMARALTATSSHTPPEAAARALLLAAANRASAGGATPTSDPTRDTADHVAFGFSVHFCPRCAALARPRPGASRPETAGARPISRSPGAGPRCACTRETCGGSAPSRSRRSAGSSTPY